MEIDDLKAYYNTIPENLTSNKIKKSIYSKLYFFKQFFKKERSIKIDMSYNKKIHMTIDNGDNYIEFEISHKNGIEVYYLNRLTNEIKKWIVSLDEKYFPKSLIEKLSFFKKEK